MIRTAKTSNKWIFFDLDDTLLPSTLSYNYAYEKLKLNQDVTFNLAKKMVKESLPSGHTSAHNRFLYFKKYLELKNDFSVEKLIRLNQRYDFYMQKKMLNFVNKSRINKHLLHLKKSFHLAIVTNENCRTQMMKIECLDPKGTIFSHIITSEEVGVEKPHPKIFKEILNRSQAKPGNVFFIGDNLINDYFAAKKLGMKSILYTQFTDESKSTNKKLNTTSDFTQLVNLLTCKSDF